MNDDEDFLFLFPLLLFVSMPILFATAGGFYFALLEVLR